MQFLFFVIATLIFGLVYFYIGYRLIKPVPFQKRHKRLLWSGIFLLSLMLPMSFILRFLVNNSILTDLIGWIAYISMGFFSLLLVFLVVRDITLLLSGLIRKLKEVRNKPAEQKTDYDPDRRKFLINTANLTALGASAILTGYGIYEARRIAQLEQITIPIAHLPAEFEGFRIVQFTDVHSGPTIKHKFVESVVEQVNNLNPHVIACTGDMVDGSVSDLKDDVAPLRDLHAPFGKFFVTGNHEYYVNALPWIEHLDKLGMSVLINENRVLQKNSSRILIAGVTDITAERFVKEHKSDPVHAIQGAPDNITKILLAHQPKSIFAASEAGYDLQISGHTHGGQYIPWSFLVTLSQPYIKGLHRHKDMWIYVSRGTGYWGPPLRIGIPSEVTLFTLSRGIDIENAASTEKIIS
jgi:predicted MPP superfamily phosphohydrolase